MKKVSILLLSIDLHFIEFSRFLITFFIFPAFIPARYIVSVLGSIAMAIIYGLKVNLSVAMVAMVNHTALKLATHQNDDSSGHSQSNALDLSVEECSAENRSTSSGSQVKSSFIKHTRGEWSQINDWEIKTLVRLSWYLSSKINSSMRTEDEIIFNDKKSLSRSNVFEAVPISHQN